MVMTPVKNTHQTLCVYVQSFEKVKAIKKSKLISQYIYSYILLYGSKTGNLGRKNKAGCYLEGVKRLINVKKILIIQEEIL
jgi:hypothetical protein